MAIAKQFILLCLSPGSRNMQLIVINFCSTYIVSNLLWVTINNFVFYN